MLYVYLRTCTNFIVKKLYLRLKYKYCGFAYLNTTAQKTAHNVNNSSYWEEINTHLRRDNAADIIYMIVI